MTDPLPAPRRWSFKIVYRAASADDGAPLWQAENMTEQDAIATASKTAEGFINNDNERWTTETIAVLLRSPHGAVRELKRHCRWE